MGRPPTLFVFPGQRIGRGVVIDPEVRVGGVRGARLRCDCGTIYEARTYSLFPKGEDRRINTTSCGCALKDHIVAVRGPGHSAPKTHGLSAHPLYRTWDLMLRRCEDPDNHKYPRYGGRGITVCERWHDVRLFVEDIERELGPRPRGYTLNRIDNDGNYEPGNVEWASARRQAENKSRAGFGSQHHGVHWAEKKQVWLTRVHLGSFKTEEEAAAVYQRAIEVLEREGIFQ